MEDAASSNYDVGNTSGSGGAETPDSPLWIVLMDRSQLVMTTIGLIANIATSLTLIKNGQIFSPIIKMMLTHQSTVDAVACLFAILLLVQPLNWIPGVYILDTLICHLWNGQFIYWYSVFISVWNLVTIASERYLAVCQPFKHSNFTKSRVTMVYVLIYLMGVVCTAGAAFQTYMEDGVCHSGYFWTGPLADEMYLTFAASTFMTFYAVPCACFFILYGMVAISMQRRKRDSQFESNRVIDTAAKQLTKTAITVTAIFIVALGYDLWYYVLGYSGVIDYKMNTPLQKIGVWLAAFNSVANPFVYALLMPTYRKCVINTFCPCARVTKPEASKESSVQTATSLA